MGRNAFLKVSFATEYESVARDWQHGFMASEDETDG